MKFYNIVLLLSLAFQIPCLTQHVKWSEPVNLNGLNTKSDEFAPVWNRFQGQLYFNSTSTGYSKFYFSLPDEKYNFTEFKLVEGEINQLRNNQSYITFETNDIAYISTYRQYPERMYLNIHQTRKKKNSWLKPFDTDSLIYPVFMGHPTVSPDGKTMIFSTTLNSDFGDTDLWMAFKQENGSWGSLLQITTLKTPGNEITPFLASSDTLYFASDGHEGSGGYDLFISVRNDGIWQIPYPLTNLNTEFDESDFTILPDGRAIFVSNRPGGVGGLDLYITSQVKDEGIEPLISKIEFSIAAQVPDIKVKSDIKEAFSPVFNYFFFDKKQILNDGFTFKQNLFSNNPDSIHQYSPFIIADRIRKLKEHKLFVTVFSNDINSNEQIEIQNKLLQLLRLPEDRASITFASLEEKQIEIFGKNTSFIKFSTNNEKIYSLIDLSEYKMEILPPAIELSLDARPRQLIDNWECKLSVGNTIGELIKKGDELPSKFFHDLNYLSKEFSVHDSLLIEIIAKDTSNRFHNFKQVYNISHSKSKQDKYITQKNIRYNEYFIILTDIRELRENAVYHTSFSSIVEKAQERKNIIIQCYSDYGKSLAPGIKEYLIEQIGGNQLKINIDNEPRKDTFAVKPHGKFLFRILVEL